MRNTVTNNKIFGVQNSLDMLKILLQVSSVLAPNLAARIALNMFLTPPKHKVTSREKGLESKSQHTVYPFSNKPLNSYTWGDGDKTVLLVHGWSGHSTHMGAFVEPLVKSGYRVIAFDGPAHGCSGGMQTDMFEFASAIHWMTETVAPVHAIVAHSFGAGCTLLANREFGLKVEKLVLIGCFSNSIYITEAFGKQFQIQPNIIVRMRKVLEKRYGNRWTWEGLAVSDMVRNLSIPTLLIHDLNDREIPYEQALELEEAGKNCTLFTTKGYGHRRILLHKAAIDRGVSFLSETNQPHR